MIYQTQPAVLPKSSKTLVDDARLLLAISNPSLLETYNNQELSKVLTWCSANKLNKNPSKSNYLVIPPKLNTPIPKMFNT